MEEKFLTLESLGVFKGLISIKQRNVHSNANQTENHTRNIQPSSVSFHTKANNVIKQTGKVNIVLKPNNITNIRKKETTYIPSKPCREMETKKSEFDIPGNDEIVMNASCDKNIFNHRGDDVSGVCILKHTEIKKEENVKKENLLDGEIEREEENDERGSNKVPSTVADWVNHLPVEGGIFSKERSVDLHQETQDGYSSEGKARAELSREASLQSSSSLESILDSRRPDPVEIFLNLGFGGLPGVDTENCRIPKRFLVPSKCKGGDWNEFLKRELLQAQNFECSSLGFRGLSGPSYRRPSAIVANIMEKLRERAVPQTHNRSRFSTVAKMVLNEKSVLNKLTPEFQSVLSPDSRKFLQNQGKKSPEVPRRRIIFGQKSFAFAHDGEFVEVGSSNIEEKTTKESQSGLTAGDSEDPPVYTNPEVLLKLRRSSFQKQKKVEEDTDVEDVFYVVGSEERSIEPPFNKNEDDNNNNSSSNNNNECSKKAGKIPRRFLSSSNLKSLEENNLSEAIRLEVEKEILSLSQKIKNMNSQDLSSVLQQVKDLRSKIDGHKPAEM